MSFVLKRVRLVVPSNKAKPSPQIGQALGSLGINMMKFCKEFNAVTVKYADVSERMRPAQRAAQGERGTEAMDAAPRIAVGVQPL